MRACASHSPASCRVEGFRYLTARRIAVVMAAASEETLISSSLFPELPPALKPKTPLAKPFARALASVLKDPPGSNVTFFKLMKACATPDPPVYTQNSNSINMSSGRGGEVSPTVHSVLSDVTNIHDMHAIHARKSTQQTCNKSVYIYLYIYIYIFVYCYATRASRAPR